MARHILKSLGLSSLFLAGLLSMLSTTACVASSDDSPCGLGAGACSEHGEGAPIEDDEEGADESADEEAPAGEEDAPSVKAPSVTPQMMCQPFCGRI
ncbi:hypothetical protein WMF27_25760 [Sorangium sp. So ce281]|uniref:hypothetical protein n=1 Tax=unclassified Sorangium TaxID=2621164 RepID=UPI003F5EACF2